MPSRSGSNQLPVSVNDSASDGNAPVRTSAT